MTFGPYHQGRSDLPGQCGGAELLNDSSLIVINKNNFKNINYYIQQAKNK